MIYRARLVASPSAAWRTTRGNCIGAQSAWSGRARGGQILAPDQALLDADQIWTHPTDQLPLSTPPQLSISSLAPHFLCCAWTCSKQGQSMRYWLPTGRFKLLWIPKKKKILKGNQKLGQGTKTAVNKSLIKIKNQMWTSSQKSLNWYGPMWCIKGLHRPLKFQFLIYCILRFNQQRRYNLHQNQPKNHSNYTNEPGTNFWYLLIKNALWTSRRWLNSSGTRTKFNSKTKPSETSPKILISPRNGWPISLPHRINQAFWSNRKISLVYKEWVLNAKISMSTRLVLKHSRRPNGYSISGMPFVLSLGPKIQVGCLNRCPFGGGFFLPQALNADSTKTKVVGFKIFCFFSFVSCLKPPPKTP